MTSALGLVAAATAGGLAGLLASARARRWAIDRDVPASSVRLPPALVALVCAALWTGTLWRWGIIPEVVPLLALGWVVVAASDVDLRAHVIPDRLTLRAPLVLAAMLITLAAVRGSAAGLLVAGITAIVLPAALLVTSLAFHRFRGQAGIGLGDIKFALSLGLVLGWLGAPHVLLAVVATFASSAAVGFSGVLMR